MIKHFTYTKANKDMSERFVYPMAIVDDKIFAVDLTKFSQKERDDQELKLKEIHTQYIQAIKDVGLGDKFRYFFIEGMDEL